MFGQNKKKKNNVRMSLTVSATTKEAIQDLADAFGISLSATASFLLENRLEIEEILREGGTVTLDKVDGKTIELRPIGVAKLLE